MQESPIRRILLLALPFLLWLLLLPAASAASDLEVANAWVTLPEPYENPSAYFVIQNKSKRPRKIVGASSKRADWIEIRRAVLKEGMMDSEKLEEMEIPAGGAVAFVPRGLSLVLIGLSSASAGEVIPIELEFGDGEKVLLDAVVRAP